MDEADLHIHTYYSDGTFSPKKAVEYAKEIQLRAIAITDHDTIGGVADAVAAGKKFGVEAIPGVEITTLYKGVELHILGYYIDTKAATLIELLRKQSDEYRSANLEIIRRLSEKGYALDYDRDVVPLSRTGFVNRAHIARAMVERGYIGDVGEAFTDELINNSGECYVPMKATAPQNAIDAIKGASGIPVLGHPAYFGEEHRVSDSDVQELVAMGIRGIEAHHFRHTLAMREHYERLARSMGLIVTGGSDCHGRYYNPVRMGTLHLPYSIVEELKKAAKR